ncbi:MAG: hypothetical protein KAW87_00980 [Candidatus Cloacimonetes bacterium]|nr:hypothetical protein [Candidatus Cloacimonadota bacterium]
MFLAENYFNEHMKNVELEKVKDIQHKELVVIVGIGAYLQNIYMDMENILKQLLFASYLFEVKIINKKLD